MVGLAWLGLVKGKERIGQDRAVVYRARHWTGWQLSVCGRVWLHALA